MLVKNIMTRHVATIGESVSPTEAAALMKKLDIRHLPVVVGGRLLGLVSDREVRGAALPAMIADITVKDLMVTKPFTVSPETPIEDAARIIHRHKIGCLPVVDEQDKLQGIVTVADLLGALIEIMGFISSSSRLDVILPERGEALQEALGIIHRHGGRIIGISLTQVRRDQPVHLFRLRKIDLTEIVKAMGSAGFQVVSSMN